MNDRVSAPERLIDGGRIVTESAGTAELVADDSTVASMSNEVNEAVETVVPIVVDFGKGEMFSLANISPELRAQLTDFSAFEELIELLAARQASKKELVPKKNIVRISNGKKNDQQRSYWSGEFSSAEEGLFADKKNALVRRVITSFTQLFLGLSVNKKSLVDSMSGGEELDVAEVKNLIKTLNSLKPFGPLFKFFGEECDHLGLVFDFDQVTVDDVNFCAKALAKLRVSRPGAQVDFEGGILIPDDDDSLSFHYRISGNGFSPDLESYYRRFVPVYRKRPIKRHI